MVLCNESNRAILHEALDNFSDMTYDVADAKNVCTVMANQCFPHDQFASVGMSAMADGFYFLPRTAEGKRTPFTYLVRVLTNGVTAWRFEGETEAAIGPGCDCDFFHMMMTNGVCPVDCQEFAMP